MAKQLIKIRNEKCTKRTYCNGSGIKATLEVFGPVEAASFASEGGIQISYAHLGLAVVRLLARRSRQASTYLGNLDRLSRFRQLIMPDTRGIGESANVTDPASLRCDRLAEDVEALRVHVGLDHMDLLGSRPRATWLCCTRLLTPKWVTRVILLTPRLRAVGIKGTDGE